MKMFNYNIAGNNTKIKICQFYQNYKKKSCENDYPSV